MRYCITTVFSILLATTAFGQIASEPYTWTPVNPPLTQPRADACAAALPDGSALVTGGITIDGGALASVDRFQLGRGFSSAPAMNNARAAHSCTTLRDGRILVAGGNDGHGNPIGTAEIYDPTSDAWTVVANLTESRWGHVAILLDNGRVLIAGGRDGDGPKDTVELFEPKRSAFVPVPFRLSSPRTNLAAALLPDGVVAILGGENSAGASAAVDLYFPGRDTLIAGAPLLAARASHSANTLDDGTVLIAGGWDGTNDLNTAELYDIHKGSAVTLGKLNTARHGHFAITLPGNGNVLLGAGLSAGAALASCEVFNPGTGAFSTIGPLGSPRARTTAVPVGEGVVLSAGGVSTDGVTPIVSTGVLPAPSLSWGLKSIFLPYQGNLAIHGRNFPNAQYTFTLNIVNIAGNSTQLLNSFFLANRSFDDTSNSLKTAGHSGKWNFIVKEQISGRPVAQTAQPVVFANVALSSSCNPCAAAPILDATGIHLGVATATLTAKITNAEPAVFKATPAGASVAFSEGTLFLGTGTVNAAGNAVLNVSLNSGSHSITAVIGSKGDGFAGTADGFIGQANVSVGVVTVSPTATTTSVSVSPSPVLGGESVTMNSVVSFNPSQLPGLIQGKTPTGTVTYTIGATTLKFPVGQSVILEASTPGFFQITAVYSGDGFFRASTSQTVGLVVKTALPTDLTPFFSDVFFDHTPGPGISQILQWRIVSVTQDQTIQFSFGDKTWIPVAGDWQGIGRTEVGAFDPATDTWHLAGVPAATVSELATVKFGRADCTGMPSTGPPLTPFLGDWSGIRHAGFGLYDSATGSWCLKDSASSGPPDAEFKFAIFDTSSILIGSNNVPAPRQIPVVGDWDGNGTTTIGIVDPTTGGWLLRNENSSGGVDGGLISLPGGIPYPGNWTGTKKTILGKYDFSVDSIFTLEDGTKAGEISRTGIRFGVDAPFVPFLLSGFILK